MKTLLFIPFLFVCSIVIGQSSKIIGVPFIATSQGIEIAQFDFPNRMSWDEAKKACNDLGNGWRLPSLKELDHLNFYRFKFGYFSNDNYWSSIQGIDNSAWCFDFQEGVSAPHFEGNAKKNNAFSVRAVRTIN